MSFIYSLFISLKSQEILSDKIYLFFNYSLLKDRLFKRNIQHKTYKQYLAQLDYIEEMILEGKYSDAVSEVELLSQNDFLSHHERFLLTLLIVEIYAVKSEPKIAEHIG